MIRTLLDRILDASIVLSFDRSGFQRHARRFRAADLDVDLDGRVYLVTGANSGLGRATARGLARRGAAVWLLCRSEERGREAEESLRKETGNEKLRYAALDLADPHSVDAFLSHFDAGRVDALVHNAGLIPPERIETPEGHELSFAVHVAGPLRLTLGLLPALRSARGRVVFVTSGGMYTRRLSANDPAWKERPYDGVVAYAETKRMQVVLCEDLATRLADLGVVVNAMHPGWADTPGVRNSLPRFFRLLGGRLRTPEQGADTAVWLAAAKAAGRVSGELFLDRRPVTAHLLPWTRESEAERRRFLEIAFRAAGAPL